MIMIKRKSLRQKSLGFLVLAVALSTSAGSVMAADGILEKSALPGDTYCQLRFPAIRPSTLASDQPELKSSSTGDVIDFYGSCNYDPKGKDEVARQNLSNFHRGDRKF